jgi:hypothetical protein
VTASYIVPIRLQTADGVEDLAAYLASLEDVEVLVIDGSGPEIFAKVHDAVREFTTHVPPSVAGKNGKARGVLSGLLLATHEKIVVADDDVHYDHASLREVLRRLDIADVVRPQNYFSPAPWHAVLDSARSLVNRAFDGDWPGTLAFRRSSVPKGYNADVLFENLELVRTIRARGGSELVARDLFVARRPATFQHFLSQRVRQAYDEFARPARFAAALAVLPAIALGSVLVGPPILAVFALLAIACAMIGWLRDGAHRYFSFLGVAAAPIWLLERAACAWLALYERFRFGGVRYGDTIIRAAASAPDELRQWAS